MKKIIRVFCMVFFFFSYTLSAQEIRTYNYPAADPEVSSRAPTNQVPHQPNVHNRSTLPSYKTVSSPPPSGAENPPTPYPPAEQADYYSVPGCAVMGCPRPCVQPGCYPSAPICGTVCGVSVCAIAFSIALVAGVAILIVSISQESSTVHQPNL